MKQSTTKNRNRILLLVVIVLVAIQFVPIDRSTPEVEKDHDFIVSTSAPVEVANILTTSCYDCHSYNTNYPWYANIAPVSWWLKNHINEGREHLNFSEWSTYSAKKADHKLEECMEEVEEGEMPLSSYTITHQDAKLTKEQKDVLLQFFSSQRATKGQLEEDDE
jgi:hypothetical protein